MQTSVIPFLFYHLIIVFVNLLLTVKLNYVRGAKYFATDYVHSVHWSLPPQKHHPPLFCQPPLKSANSPSPPF